MTPCEHDQNDTREAAAGANARKEDKPSLLTRIRRAFTPKMAVWLITQTGDEDTVVYAAPTTKDAFIAAKSLVFRHFFPHYSAWLPLHGYGDPEGPGMAAYGSRSDAWHEYISANIDAAEEYLSTLEIHRAFYDRRSFASMLRIMCGVAPLGLETETDEEIDYWVSAAMDALSEQEGRRNDAHEEGTKEEKNTSAPLDRKKAKGHNAGERRKDAGAKRGTGRPRKKGGSAKKTPGTKKGETNEN